MVIRAFGGDGVPRGGASPSSERVPPHNLDAEESVLGSMLISKDAIAEVLELVVEDDFYRPAHRTVFRSVLGLYARGEAVDAVTVMEDLRRGGVLEDIGGALFIHGLTESVPTAANAAYYSRIVKDTGTLRRLIDAGTRIVQLGFDNNQTIEQAVDVAEQLVYQVAQGRVTDDYHSLRDVLTDTLEAIERLHNDSREITGVPTGFPEFDRITSGLQASNLIIVAARPAVGKCITFDTIVTEAKSGERMMIAEFVRRGQAGEDLRIHTLTDDWKLAVTRPSALIDNGERQVFRLTTRSGRSIRATANHPFRMPSGWVPLERLRPGSPIVVATGVPAHSPAPGGRAAPSPVGTALRAAAVGSATVRPAAPPQVFWDEVVSVEPAGVARVYDLTIDGTHNFVAEDIVVHNSTLGLDIARHASVRAGIPSVIFSLEMSRTELVQRLMCAECSVDMQRLRTGRLEESDWARLTRNLGKLADAPLYVDDSASTTLMEIRAKARRLKQRNGLGLIVVDYLQLLQPGRKVDNRQQEVSEMSRGLKLLAKELETPVIAISQLSRQTEARADRRPMLSDLRESGSLEQDADMVVFIYRDEIYDPESPRKGEADFIIAKHRNGPTDSVTVTFQGQYSRFAPMARDV